VRICSRDEEHTGGQSVQSYVRRVIKYSIIAFVCGGCVAALCLWWVPSGATLGQVAAEHSRAAPGAVAAASQPTTAKAYPSDELSKACHRHAAALRGRLDDTFTVVTFPPFVVAGQATPKAVERLAAGSVVRPAGAMWARYFRHKPDQPITVLLFSGNKNYRDWAECLFGDRDVAHFGYYRPGDRTLVMNIDTGSGTLVHELTHALIAYDFPDVATWFNEGLASLHEQCRVLNDDIVGLTNWRLPALQAAIRDGKIRSLRDLVTKRDFYGPLRGLNYAQGRYFVMYMQKKRLLAKFYRYLRAHHNGADADVRAVEHVFGKPIAQVDADFRVWVATLKFPSR